MSEVICKVAQITDTVNMHKACAATIGKSETRPSLKAMLHCEHSPIREIEFEITLIGIPTFVSVHLVRHSATGQKHYVQSMRDDRGGKDITVDRDTPVVHRMVLNAQHLIDISRRRLCRKTHKDTRKVWLCALEEVFKIMPELREVCMPQCEYRGNICYELKSCGHNPHYKTIKGD